LTVDWRSIGPNLWRTKSIHRSHNNQSG